LALADLAWQKVLAKVTTLLLTMLSVYTELCKHLINPWNSAEVTMRSVSGLFIEAKERSNIGLVKNLICPLKMGCFFM